MADSTTVDLAAMAAKTTELLKTSREDFEESLTRVQEVIDDISWWTVNRNTLSTEIGTVTFSEYQSVKELVDAVVFEFLPTRDLLETDIQKSKKHVFISDSLDTAEAAVTKITSIAGAGEMKALSGVYLSDAMRNALIGGQRRSDGRDRNDSLALLGRYSSANQTGNEEWLNAQFDAKETDRDRNVFSTLFKMAQENVKWAFGQGITIEQLHEDFTARYNRLFFDITQANIAAYKAEVKANISEFEAELKKIDAQMSVEALKFDKESAEWGMKIDQANARMGSYVKEYSQKISTNTELMALRIAAGKNIADGYKSIYSAYSSQYSGVSLSNSTE